MTSRLMTVVLLFFTTQLGIVDFRHPTAEIAPKELDCIIENVYKEARGEPFEGQIAVASVTLNRVGLKGRPDTICGVVHQRGQFSWTADARLKRKKARGRARSMAAWAVAEAFFRRQPSAMAGQKVAITATYYHAKSVSPFWAKKYVKVQTIGSHIFYRQPL